MWIEMKQYKELIENVLQNGILHEDRTGVGTLSVFGAQMRFNLSEGFPLVTMKKVPWKPVVSELLWFLEGSTDERRLAELNYGVNREHLLDKTTIWTENADEQAVALGYKNGALMKELGPIYGKQWRSYGEGGKDQIREVLRLLKEQPNSRRIIVSAWNPNDLDKMTLPPCHTLFHFKVINGKLSCLLYQRSGDIGLGIPFNIASYSLLTHILAREAGLGVGDFVHTIGDAHIYLNHVEPLREMIRDREPRSLPELVIDSKFNLERGLKREFSYTDADFFTLRNYNPHPFIKLQMAV
jgi:thymidylate synthase